MKEASTSLKAKKLSPNNINLDVDHQLMALSGRPTREADDTGEFPPAKHSCSENSSSTRRVVDHMQRIMEESSALSGEWQKPSRKHTASPTLPGSSAAPSFAENRFALLNTTSKSPINNSNGGHPSQPATISVAAPSEKGNTPEISPIKNEQKNSDNVLDTNTIPTYGKF